MSNKLIFATMLFVGQYALSSEIDKYPQFKEIMGMKHGDVVPLPLVLEDGYYVWLEKKDVVESHNETGKISIKNDNLYVEVQRVYPSQEVGTLTGSFKYFEPGKSFVCGEKVINTFVNGYLKLWDANDSRAIHMALVNRVDYMGDGQILKVEPNIRCFAIDKSQVDTIIDAIAAAVVAEQTSKSGIAFLKKLSCLLCGVGFLGFVVFCCSKLLK